jgi:putative DNA primase/helicase
MSAFMSGTGAIDFEGLARSLLARARSLLRDWLPNGKLKGHEYRVGSIRGEEGDSLSINVTTGAWAEFNPSGGGLKGGDLISLYAAIHNLSQVDAAKELGGDTHRPAVAATDKVVEFPGKSRTPGDYSKGWTPILPIPADAPAPPTEHPVHGAPVHVAHYRDKDGRLLGLIYRCEPGGSKKKEIPTLTYCLHESGRRAWKWISLPEPRSLYGAELLGQPGRVLVVEGEPKCEAARRILGDIMIVVAWPGGSSAVIAAEWSLLAGRDVVVWPDADPPGRQAAAQIAIQLRHHGATASVVVPPKGVKPGWDLGDAEKEGWSAETIMGFVNGGISGQQQERGDGGPPNGGDGDGPAPIPQQQAQSDFTPLGHDRGRFHFMTAGGGQVRDFSARDLQTVGCLCELAPLLFWEANFPGKDGFSIRSAGDWLVRMSYKAGIYDPERLRGRGAWLDDVRVVLHAGDHLVVDGVETALASMESHYIYEQGRRMSLAIADEPLSEANAENLLDLCMSCSWDEPVSMGRLLAGWLVIAPVCGAMPWRPHIYVTGEAGTGKSWIIENIIRKLIGDIALAVASKTTEAGVRGKLGLDARPVIFDEFESQNEQDRQRIQQILDLARQASSEEGAEIVKGTQTGGSKSFRIRSCFAFSSISLGLQQAADESRTVVLSLFLDPDPEFRARAFRHLQDLQAKVATPEFRSALLARTLKLLPTIRENADVFASAIARSGAARRTGDTIGVLLAGAWSLKSDKVATAAEADAFLEARDWLKKAVKRSETEPEWRRALDFLVQIPLRTPVSNRAAHQEIPVGELLEAVVYYSGATVVSKEDAETTLHRAGLKVSTENEGGKTIHHLTIANSSEPLRRAFSGTPWASSWSTTLARTPGSAKLQKSARFGSLVSRALNVPLSVALGGQDQ